VVCILVDHRLHTYVHTYIHVQLCEIRVFPISNFLKQEDALSQLFFNFALECAIKRVQVNQGGLKLNDAR
jgi:hypothetical protein